MIHFNNIRNYASIRSLHCRMENKQPNSSVQMQKCFHNFDETPTCSVVHKKGPATGNIYVTHVLEVWEVAI